MPCARNSRACRARRTPHSLPGGVCSRHARTAAGGAPIGGTQGYAGVVVRALCDAGPDPCQPHRRLAHGAVFRHARRPGDALAPDACRQPGGVRRRPRHHGGDGGGAARPGLAALPRPLDRCPGGGAPPGGGVLPRAFARPRSACNWPMPAARARSRGPGRGRRPCRPRRAAGSRFPPATWPIPAGRCRRCSAWRRWTRSRPASSPRRGGRMRWAST